MAPDPTAVLLGTRPSSGGRAKTATRAPPTAATTPGSCCPSRARTRPAVVRCLPGGTGLCALAQGEGEDAFFGTDPQGTCPPSQEQANAGLVQCSVAALTANRELPNSYIALSLDVAYANDPTPANPTASITPSTGLSAGQKVTVNVCAARVTGGGPVRPAPRGSPAPPARTAQRRPSRLRQIFMGATRASAVPVTNSTVAITPANYNCGTSGGSALSPPGPVATCVLGAAPVTNSTGTVNSGSTTFPTHRAPSPQRTWVMPRGERGRALRVRLDRHHHGGHLRQPAHAGHGGLHLDLGFGRLHLQRRQGRDDGGRPRHRQQPRRVLRRGGPFRPSRISPTATPTSP